MHVLKSGVLIFSVSGKAMEKEATVPENYF